MQDDTNQQPSNDNQSATVQPPYNRGGEKVIQPSATIKQELEAPRQQQATQPTVIAPQSSQPAEAQTPTYNSPTPTPDNRMSVGMSASQMGFNNPKSKLFDFNPKGLIIKGLVAIVILGGIFAVLVSANIIALSEFKTISYLNNKGTQFKVTFYTKHTSKDLKSGGKQLVSKVSKDGKFPLNLSISTAEGATGYNRAKDCASFTKVFDVQNNNLDQKISVCDPLYGTQIDRRNASGTIYLAGFMENNQTHIITISQDYSGIDLSSKSGAQESLTRFGMEPYKEDIEKIVSSIKVE